MDEEHVYHTMENYSASFNLEKEENPANMGGPWRHDAEWNKPDVEREILCDLTCMESKNITLKETKSRMVVARGWRMNGKMLIKGYRCSVIWWISAGLKHIVVTIVNSKVTMRIEIYLSHHNNKNKVATVWGEVCVYWPYCAKPPAICTCLHPHTVHLKFK